MSYWNIIRCYKTLWHVRKHSQMLQHILKSWWKTLYKTFSNVVCHPQMLSDIFKCSETPQDVRRHPQVFYAIHKRSMTSSNLIRYTQMLPNILKCYQTSSDVLYHPQMFNGILICSKTYSNNCHWTCETKTILLDVLRHPQMLYKKLYERSFGILQIKSRSRVINN